MCCCLDGSPVEDKKGRIKTFEGEDRVKFQVDMVRFVYFFLFVFHNIIFSLDPTIVLIVLIIELFS